MVARGCSYEGPASGRVLLPSRAGLQSPLSGTPGAPTDGTPTAASIAWGWALRSTSGSDLAGR